jgi:hypothetical protein
MTKEKLYLIEKNLAAQIDSHLKGLAAKIIQDFSVDSFDGEISDLRGDQVYEGFNLGTEEYALIRKMGRISISIGRRLGEIYDKIPRIIAHYAFNIAESDVAPILGGKLELDTCIDYAVVDKSYHDHIKSVSEKYIRILPEKGLGIEIRYNFNPNDSSRLRKDVNMAELIIEKKLTPVYLVFSSISPRDEAIARLKRAGWHFLIGNDAYAFVSALYDIDFKNLFTSPNIRTTIDTNINALMENLFTSHPFTKVYEKYLKKIIGEHIQ